MTQRTAHLAVFYGLVTTDEQPIYRLVYRCPREPQQGDTVTTAVADVTCTDCLDAIRPANVLKTTRVLG